MSQTIKLTAADGATIDAYRADPTGTPKGGLVVLQEIFGVNPHIRRVADGFAAEGYRVIAPALFDRVKPGVELDYNQEGMGAGIALMGQVDQGKALLDVAAAVAAASDAGKVGIVGYCWGGSLAYAAACSVDGLAAAVGYYGGNIAKSLDRKPKVPVMLHFGERDAHIPMSDVAAIEAALPDVPVYTYDADHGFNCDARGSYDKPSAAQALERTLAFLARYVG
ncbi:dienelactone hydrolase family protein [Lichenibacterium ramalinae]|uniref:Dienelactone hydrolase family protein n=1 Tax=Lichenibacterium ramalinae TaxID=2316527 RepID=A0A4Q2RAK1_9HYPH|nr:dienelactone hydrolase family protein [Lichenibacterium ramalinae]RYB04120.1 dienelactone hydrolase family protein [Lichenibacterium ramalinae]